MTAFLHVMLFLFTAVAAHAQPRALPGWLSPEIGKQTPALQYSISGYPSQKIQDQRDREIQMLENKATFVIPAHQSQQDEWLFTGRMTAQAFRTQALLPTTAEPFPDQLWNIGFGTAYRRRFENGWIGGSVVDIGSASNKPFYSWDETTLSVNLFTRIPHEGQNAWLLLLNYNNNREFLPHVPIPGVGYIFQQDRLYRIAVGIPFLFAEIRPQEGAFSMEFVYLPIRTVHAGINYDLHRKATVYGHFDWGNEEFFRTERTDKSKRLFYYEKRLTAGIRFTFNRHFFANLAGGYAFDRLYFEGKDFSDKDFNRLEIENGPFARLQLGVRY